MFCESFYRTRKAGLAIAHGRTVFSERRQAAMIQHPPLDFEMLIVYLKKNPVIRYVGTEPSGAMIDELRTFKEYEGGGLWFEKSDGQLRFAPVACGMTAAATGMRYHKDHFSMTKFGHTSRFYYVVENGQTQ
jgi:hypothetical protein